MKKIVWEDERGWLHISLLRDSDNPNRPEIGLPSDPPPLESVFDGAERELHNELVRRGLVTWDDVMESQDGITSTIKAVFKSRLIELYRKESNSG